MLSSTGTRQSSPVLHVALWPALPFPLHGIWLTTGQGERERERVCV